MDLNPRFRSPAEIKTVSKMVKLVDTEGYKTVNHYRLYQELGRGYHGKVKLCRDIYTNVEYAIKIIEKNPKRGFQSKLSNAYKQQQLGVLPNPQLEKIKVEIAILKKCQHPNIVHLNEVIDDPRSAKIYLVLDYMSGGEVQWQKEDIDGLMIPANTLEQTLLIFRDLIAGIQYLHNQGIIHRDIKPSNLLKDSNGNIRIADFGVSMLVGQESTPKNIFKINGSPAFVSPELCLIDDISLHTSDCDLIDLPRRLSKVDRLLLEESTSPSPLGAHIDIWSIGVTLYCLVYGRLPFEGSTEFELYQHIINQPVLFSSSIHTSPDLHEILVQMLEKSYTKRITLSRIKFHPYTTSEMDPEERMNYLDAMNTFHQVVPTTYEISNAVRLKESIRRLSRGIQDLMRFGGETVVESSSTTM